MMNKYNDAGKIRNIVKLKDFFRHVCWWRNHKKISRRMSVQSITTHIVAARFSEPNYHLYVCSILICNK